MKRCAKGAIVTAAFVLATSPAAASPKPLISYFQPMPIVGKLSSTVWGGTTVGPRDPANGLEDNGAMGGVGPQQETYFYWDGKILKGNDGKYHLYASRWLHSNGFGPPGGGGTGWHQSIPVESISDNVMGPYVTRGDCYAKNLAGNNLGHNVTALTAPTGTSPYTLSVGEIVTGQMFSASSPNGPWNLLGPTGTNFNGHTVSACGRTSSNFTFTVGPNNRFWATSRNGCVMDSDNVLGPYKIETDSVLPNLENNDNNHAEDEVIWYSGGYFHIVYNYWDVQRGYHIMSKDGITNWTSTGLAYQASQTPANSNSGWLRYTDGTVNHWHNMERVGVYQENGHVTHFTFAVTDVDKNLSGINNGGSKILVVPFNGVQFDCDNGDPTSCAEAAVDGGAVASNDSGGLNDGAPGAPGEGGGDSSDLDGTASSGAAGSDGAGGSGAAGSGVPGSGGGSGAASSGGAGGSGAGGSGGAGSSGAGGSGGGSGALLADGGSVSASGSSNQSTGQTGGCGCVTAGQPDSTTRFAACGALLLSASWIYRRRRARTNGPMPDRAPRV